MSGQVGKPKIYIDYLSYFRASGIGLDVVGNNSATNIAEDYSDVFSYNPYNTKTFTPIQEGNGGFGLTEMSFKVVCGGGTGESLKLTSSINYLAMLNHNARDLDLFASYPVGVNSNNQPLNSYPYDIVGADKNNFSLWGLYFAPVYENSGVGVSILLNNYTEPFRLGSIIAGRTYSFPNNQNLSMNINYDADGIKKTRTLGGRDIVDVNYYKQPTWDGNPPFVPTNTFGGSSDLSATSHIGRRSWALTFSFLTANDTFPQDMGENFMFDNVFHDDGTPSSWTNHTTENITSHFMTLTMNGQLPFLFQPDDSKDTYAMCRLRSNSFSVQQSAPNLYTCKMTFDETW